MTITKNINGSNFTIIPYCMTFDEALTKPGKMLKHAEFMRLAESNFPFSEIGISGPFWLDTKISCMLRAVMIIQPDGTAVSSRYDKTFLCYFLGKSDD